MSGMSAGAASDSPKASAGAFIALAVAVVALPAAVAVHLGVAAPWAFAKWLVLVIGAAATDVVLKRLPRARVGARVWLGVLLVAGLAMLVDTVLR